MSELLVAIWFAAAVGGVIAVLVGLFASGDTRPRWLAIAVACFVVAGVLGILSIGILFLVLAGACFLSGRRARDTTAS